jgi:PKHD-type hydroxylase
MSSHELHRFVSIPSVFKPAECSLIISLAQLRQQHTGKVLHAKRGSTLSMARRCDLAWLAPEDDTKWIFDRLWPIMQEQNAAIWNFDIDRISALQYLHYGPLNWYARHVDNGSPAVATRKLSMSIQLSAPSDFVGGRLRIWSQSPERHASDAQGSVTIFPCYLPHQANPVWWGSRHALIAWCHGASPLR